MWQDWVVFFEMVWKASEWDFTKTERKREKKSTNDADGNQNKCEEVCEPLNALCTAKLKEVVQAGRDAFAWQKREDTLAKPKGADFEQWLRLRQITLRPLMWEVCCDAYTRFTSSYEAVHDGKRCFSVHQFEFTQDDWGPSRGSAECNFFVR